MSLCPRGHSSETDDFCDECGLPMGGAPGAPSSSTQPAPAKAQAGPSVAAAEFGDERCPWCDTPRTGRFCEEDGFDFVLTPVGSAAPASGSPETTGFPAVSSGSSGPPVSSPPVPATSSPAPSGWVVRVEADRRYFDTVLDREGPDIAQVSFPSYYPAAEVPLADAEIRIGRRRSTPGSRAPDIDLTGPPLDPGVSHLHAVLLAGPTGWSLVDPGSTNGTTINYADEPIATDTPVPVSDGDRIHVGAYTTLLITRADD